MYSRPTIVRHINVIIENFIGAHKIQVDNLDVFACDMCFLSVNLFYFIIILPDDKVVVCVNGTRFVKSPWWLIIKNVVSGILLIVSAISCFVSMSAPESGSSRIANSGFVNSSRNSIMRLRSPPEKPTLILRFNHSRGMPSFVRAVSRFSKNSAIDKSWPVLKWLWAAQECFRKLIIVNPGISGTCCEPRNYYSY